MATPNYNGVLQASEEQRQQAMNRLTQLAQARQRWTNQMYKRQMDEMKKAEATRKEYEDKWWQRGIMKGVLGALSGGMMGAMSGNPYGVLAGAGAGAVGGFSSEYATKEMGYDPGFNQLGQMGAQFAGSQLGKPQSALADFDTFKRDTAERDMYARSVLEAQRYGYR